MDTEGKEKAKVKVEKAKTQRKIQNEDAAAERMSTWVDE